MRFVFEIPNEVRPEAERLFTLLYERGLATFWGIENPKGPPQFFPGYAADGSVSDRSIVYLTGQVQSGI
jgi:hypothetical protein